MKSNAKEIPLHRGSISEAARRISSRSGKKISRQAVWAAWHKERPDVVEVIEEVVREFLQTRKANEARLNRIKDICNGTP
jgi:hypothetical protein